MRLYLSSFRLGGQTDRLLAMVGSNKRVAVLVNACDSKDSTTRSERLVRELKDLRNLGFEPLEIDLRDYFHKPFTTEDLADYGLVWVRGGNVFNLRRAMKYSGFDKVIAELLERDAIVYGGYSAGVCVLSPDLHGIELCDDPNDIPVAYESEIIWKGLNILPYAVAPHYKSDHPESLLIDRVVEYFEHHNTAYETLRDGEVILVDNK